MEYFTTGTLVEGNFSPSSFLAVFPRYGRLTASGWPKRPVDQSRRDWLIWTAACTVSCYGNRQTVASPSSVWIIGILGKQSLLPAFELIKRDYASNATTTTTLKKKKKKSVFFFASQFGVIISRMVTLQLSFFRPCSDRIIIMLLTLQFLRCWCLPFNGDSYPQSPYRQSAQEGVVQHAAWRLLLLHHAAVIWPCSKVDLAFTPNSVCTGRGDCSALTCPINEELSCAIEERQRQAARRWHILCLFVSHSGYVSGHLVASCDGRKSMSSCRTVFAVVAAFGGRGLLLLLLLLFYFFV